jgi:hypothetical protein
LRVPGDGQQRQDRADHADNDEPSDRARTH